MSAIGSRDAILGMFRDAWKTLLLGISVVLAIVALAQYVGTGNEALRAIISERDYDLAEWKRYASEMAKYADEWKRYASEMEKMQPSGRGR